MKKHFIIPATVVALIGFGAYFGHTPIQSNETSTLFLANAEALADNSEMSIKDIEDYCPGGPRECVRLSTKPGTMYVLYMP